MDEDDEVNISSAAAADGGINGDRRDAAGDDINDGRIGAVSNDGGTEPGGGGRDDGPGAEDRGSGLLLAAKL